MIELIISYNVHLIYVTPVWPYIMRCLQCFLTMQYYYGHYYCDVTFNVVNSCSTLHFNRDRYITSDFNNTFMWFTKSEFTPETFLLPKYLFDTLGTLYICYVNMQMSGPRA